MHLESQNWLGLFSIGGWLIFLSLRSSDFTEAGLIGRLEFSLVRVATAINDDERLGIPDETGSENKEVDRKMNNR